MDVRRRTPQWVPIFWKSCSSASELLKAGSNVVGRLGHLSMDG